MFSRSGSSHQYLMSQIDCPDILLLYNNYIIIYGFSKRYSTGQSVCFHELMIKEKMKKNAIIIYYTYLC